MNRNSAFIYTAAESIGGDVLDAAWKLTGKRGNTAGIDAMRGEDVERSERGRSLGPSRSEPPGPEGKAL